jgi:hypothetical protein
MSFRQAFMFVAALILFSVVTSGAAEAQWSLLAPGDRAPSPGRNRYYMLVLANPVPGLENDFNDWYSNMMMGDLMQLPGWLGVQRFRIISDAGLDPRPTNAGYQNGYLAIWDEQGADYGTNHKLMTDSLAGGKISHGAGFDYLGGAGDTYQAMGPRISSGKKSSLPAVTDFRTRRPDRYIVMDFSNPAAGKKAEFEGAISQHIRDVLALPGWMAAQRFKLAPPSGAERPGPNSLQYLTVWEVEAPPRPAPQSNPARGGQKGQSANKIQSALNEAIKAGKIKKLPIDEATWEFTYWEPVTPYITKELFVR